MYFLQFFSYQSPFRSDPLKKLGGVLAALTVNQRGYVAHPYGVAPKHQPLWRVGGHCPREVIETPQGQWQGLQPRLLLPDEVLPQSINGTLHSPVSAAIGLRSIYNRLGLFNAGKIAQRIEEGAADDRLSVSYNFFW